jgi:molybdenum cofactor cytidylyltransferase
MQTFAVIPAAGRSQRMGEPKLLMPWGRATLIEHVLDAWRASRVDHLVLVVHPQDDRLAELGAARGAFVVRPTLPPEEMKISVRIALVRIWRAFRPQPTDAWLMAPADMPTLSPAVVERLIDAYQASLADAPPPTIWVPVCQGRRGHPVLFPWSMVRDVERLGDDEGINALLARHPVATIEAEAAQILDDLDTPEDYRRLRQRENA